jgi:signal transduction histidine kinase
MAPTSPAFTFAKAGELRQIVANLIGNSLDAMRFGGCLFIRTPIESWGPKGSKRTRLTMADTGSGIPENIRSTIFERIVTSKGETGTGLGLWVSGELARKNGWTIRLRTRSDRHRHGTAFSIVMAELRES